ncbi:MAG TPA: acyl-CoA dehydrogenase family protein [Pseudonocardia sp.]|nr:acyl-CoA dehydrogenase family protein [Pseudonocardia sp.]
MTTIETSPSAGPEPGADGAPLDGAAILANAERIAPLLREHAAEVEAARRLTPPVVEALRGAGVFRMTMPGAWGGPEVDLLTQLRVIETLSRADGSAGWCAMIGSDSGYYGAFLAETDARDLYPELDLVTAGWIIPAGTLEMVDGGYRLSGRWSFGSGVSHADVVSAGAVVTENGRPRLGPDGRPESRVALLPASQVTVHDTWHTTGLCGSGSHDYSVEGQFVPAGHTFGFARTNREETLYRWPGLLVANVVAVPLGVAADALDVAMDLLSAKVSMPEMILARDEPRVRAAVARAQAMVGSARSYVDDTFGGFWAVLEAGDPPDFTARAQLAGCFVHTVTTCRDAVAVLIETVGTAGIQRGGPLERHHRDLITMAQHLMGQPKMREWAGGLWFGQASPSPVL